MKKYVLLHILVFFASAISAQCAMCKAVVESGNETMAAGVNDGITYLMVFPYILIGGLFYAIYRYRKTSEK